MLPNFTTKKNAVFSRGFYQYIGINRAFVYVYGFSDSDIVEVEFKVSENQSIDKCSLQDVGDYWGWYDFKAQDFVFIFQNRPMLNMAFTYGIKAQEEVKKDGKAYRLELVKK